jgi:serine protease AprX
MTTSAIRGRRAPVGAVAAAAALALLATPLPASGSAPSRTALLTLTDGSSLSELAGRVAAVGGSVLETLDLADSLLVRIPSGVPVPAGAAEVPDVPMRVNSAMTSSSPALPTYRDTIDAPADAGEGATVALVDTGVAELEALGDVEHLAVDGTGFGDGFGHGTFLAGIIRGTEELPGVAPAATLIDVKVADAEGATSLSKVLAGLEMVGDRSDVVDVVNLSLSSDAPLPPGFDPLSRALDRLWGMGITVVVAAGNGGDEGVSSPGNDPVLLTAGALDEHGNDDRADDAVADFSAKGSGFSKDKPDLVAPGVSIMSTAAPDSVALTQAAPGTVSEDGLYMRGSGTSMAAAMVTGAAAAVLAANPDMEPSGVKALLMSTAYDLTSADGAGSGGLDLGSALKQAPHFPTEVRPGRAGGAVGDWGPAEVDAEAWAAFADAWESGDFDAVKAAWDAVSWQTQQWASRMWMLAVLADSLSLPAEAFQARSSAARSWAFDEWMARSWAARSWAARSWAARSWATDDWAARSWAARSWATSEWDAGAWSMLD